MRKLSTAVVLLAVLVVVSAMSVSAAFAGGPCSAKDPNCPGGGPPFNPPGLDEGSPAPVRVSPSNRIVIDITGAGIQRRPEFQITNVASGIVIDVTGAGILIDITGAGIR